MIDRLFKAALPLLGGLLLIGTLAACDSGPGSDNEEDDADDLAGASNPILVVLEPLGDDMTTVNYTDEDYYMTICYENGECDREDSGASGVGGLSRPIMTSDSDRTVVGVEVDVLIEDEPGKLIVGESDSEEVSAPPELKTVYHETDDLEPGDEVSFKVGDVE